MAKKSPPTGVKIDHEAGTDRSVFATWTWTETHTDHYEVWWEYSTANTGVWFTGSESSEKHKISQYSYPDNAKQVRFRVKPIAEKKSGSDEYYWTSDWSETKYRPVSQDVTIQAYHNYDPPTDLEMLLEAGTDRTYHAKWHWKHPHTAMILARWMYRTANNEWFFGPTEEVVIEEAQGDGIYTETWQSEWTAPNNALKVRCQVKPISMVAWETDLQTMHYWASIWSDWLPITITSKVAPPTSDAPNNLIIDIQNGTERTLFATWSWNKSKTDHYFIHWQYDTGNGTWFEGATDDNVKVKNHIYTAPDNAVRIRCWVKAYAADGADWSESATSSVAYFNEFLPDEAGAIVNSTIKIQRDNQNETELVTTWQSNASNFEYEFEYSTGLQDPNTKKFIWEHFNEGNPMATTQKVVRYSPPTNATRVQFRVREMPGGPWSKRVPFTYSEQLKKTTKSTKHVKGMTLMLEEGSDRNLIAKWTWEEANTASYDVTWQYSTGQGIWFYGERNKSVNQLYDTYSAPANATSVRFYVRPIAATKKVQGIDTPYWTAETSNVIYWRFSNTGSPGVAPVPAVLLDGLNLTAEVDIYDELADKVEFEIVKDDTTSFGIFSSKVRTNHAAIKAIVDIGGEYKVRARALHEVEASSNTKVVNRKAATEYGEWSEFTENFATIPAAVKSILWHRAISTTEIQIAWSSVKNITNYKLEYATNPDYFDHSGQTTVIDVTGTDNWIVDNLEAGNTYFFRVCAVNDVGQSSWTPNYADNQSYPVILGTRPSPPTTWSDTTSGVIGEDIYLYWTHNSEDESVQTDAEVKLIINNEDPIIVPPTYPSDSDLPSYYVLNTSNRFGVQEEAPDSIDTGNEEIVDVGEEVISENPASPGYEETSFEGAVIVWQVRTKGILQGDEGWSKWSTARTVIIYAQPTLFLYVGNNPEFNDKMYELNRYPLLIHAEASPDAQNAIGFNVSIIANESYETRDSRGTRMSVRDQEPVFQKYYPAKNGNTLDVSLTAGDMVLDNNITYTVMVTAAMDSGLSADNSWTFIARWDGDVLVPDAEVTINPETLSAYIRPFCNNEDGDLIDGVYLTVYRIEYDGRVVEIGSNLPNGEVTITDPHPSLNYARYRVTATYEATGIMGFRDIPGVFVGETGIVVQWDEEWNAFFTNDGAYQDPFVETTDRGSILKLPYNIEVSDSNDMDVALNEYIGRAHPVSYYGTQLGVKGSWQGTIRRDDIQTIYALRRLAVYRGDVYVREPSGVGYWANVSVSFSKRYNEMVIPVTLNVTRVEGGI